MKKYITHHRYKAVGICGKFLNIPYGTILFATDGIIMTPKGQAICYITSENAHLHFSCDEDQCGLERGLLTYTIAYKQRKTTGAFRFTEEERELLRQDWSHFLKDNVDVILFNHRFFDADINELRNLATALDIKVKECDK